MTKERSKSFAHSTSSAAMLAREAVEGEGPVVATLSMKLVVEHNVDIRASKSGEYTLGQLVDQHLADAAQEDATVEAVTLEVNRQYWNELKESIRSSR